MLSNMIYFIFWTTGCIELYNHDGPGSARQRLILIEYSVFVMHAGPANFFRFLPESIITHDRVNVLGPRMISSASV